VLGAGVAGGGAVPRGPIGFDGTLLRAARKAAALTQRELGERVGTTEAGVSQWETGRRVPSSDRVAELARSLGVRPGDLVTASGEVSLAYLRAVAGLDQHQVAGRARMDTRAYGRIERGQAAHLSTAHAGALAAALGVEIDDVRIAYAAARAAYIQR
jgi:transcriptional regulator with XRE-family HTH domain